MTAEPIFEQRDRVVALTGGHNFRDIGGYPAMDGKTTAWGLVYRSGTMAELDDDDHARLHELGLRMIHDFRTTRERRKRPSRLPKDATFSIWSRDYEMSAGDLTSTLRKAGATPEATRKTMIGLYASLAYEQAPAYRETFQAIADGALPLVFHCSAGKDRTGIAAALLLELLGVSRPVIYEDYVLTDQFLERIRDIVRRDPHGDRFRDIPQDLWTPMLRADPAYLDALYETIDARHGGAEGFIRAELGLGDSEIASIRQRLLV